MFKSFLWKLLERFGVQGVQFILQIILARLLSPDLYGVLAIMIIFTTIANVFIQNGFNTSLVQAKDVTEEDYSSVFWVTLAIAVLLYIVIFVTAPFIAGFYGMPEIVTPFRVLAIVLIPGAVNSIQVAKVSRDMDFKRVFTSNIVAITISGIVGIVIAYKGGGLWALVAQYLINVVVSCAVMLFTVKLKFRFVCNIERIQVLFSYGWKLLVSAFIEVLYQDLSSLVIGKKYDSEMLGYYNRGKQFPQFIISAVNGAVQSVLLPAMSSEQDDKIKVKQIMRNSMTISAYIIFPMMAGLAAIAEPMVSILLTEKWIPCVPYLQIFCFSLAFWPVHTSNIQAINAVGRSDIFLKIEIVKKIYGIIILLIAIFCFDSPIAIAMTGVITSILSCFVNAFPNKKLIGYSYNEQMKDIMPSFVMSSIMFAAVYFIGKIGLNNILTIVFQIILGVGIYVILSLITKNKIFFVIISFFRRREIR